MPFRNPNQTATAPAVDPWAGIDWPFYLGLGESTSEGFLANPAITPQWSVPAGMMAIGGVRPYDGGAVIATNYASLTQVFSQIFNDGSGNYGETPDPGGLISMGQATKQLYGLDLAITGKQHIISNVGIGGQNIAQLMTGANWTLISGAISAFAALATASGKVAKLCAIPFTIGQNDMTDGTSTATFKANAIAFRQQVIDAWNTASGRSDDPPMFMVTVGSFNDAGNILAIPQAMIELGQEYPTKFINCGPAYQFTYSDGVGVHYANTGSKSLGYVLGWGQYLYLVRGRIWATPTLDTTERVGPLLRLNYMDVFTAPLQFNTSWVTDPGDYGFLLMQGDEARASSCSITAGVLTVGGTQTGTFAVGQTIWAAKYTQLNNVPVGTTITADLGGGTYQLSNTFTMPGPASGPNFVVIGQTVVDIKTPTITGDRQVTLETVSGADVQAGWVVAYATRGTRAAGPQTGSRGNLCDSTAFAVTGQNPTFTIRGYSQIFEETLV